MESTVIALNEANATSGIMEYLEMYGNRQKIECYLFCRGRIATLGLPGWAQLIVRSLGKITKMRERSRTSSLDELIVSMSLETWQAS